MPPPFNMQGVYARQVRDESNREVTLYERESPLKALFRMELIDELQFEAGERFYRAWDRMRRLALAAIPPYPKVGQWERGFAHPPEPTDADIALGIEAEKDYNDAYRALIESGAKAVIAVEAVCFGQVLPWKLADVHIEELRKGLDALAVWLRGKRAAVA
jgi:hypothetical protein